MTVCNNDQRDCIRRNKQIQTVGLSLPDGLAEAPERRENEEHWQKMSVWDPDKEKNDEGCVQNAANGDERFTVHVTLCAANQTRAHGVGHAQCDHTVTNVLNADCTANVGLQNRITNTDHVRRPLPTG